MGGWMRVLCACFARANTAYMSACAYVCVSCACACLVSDGATAIVCVCVCACVHACITACARVHQGAYARAGMHRASTAHGSCARHRSSLSRSHSADSTSSRGEPSNAPSQRRSETRRIIRPDALLLDAAAGARWMPAARACRYDYVRVYAGETTAAPLLGSFSGVSLPPPLAATCAPAYPISATSAPGLGAPANRWPLSSTPHLSPWPTGRTRAVRA
jgi:hypothetical protein